MYVCLLEVSVVHFYQRILQKAATHLLVSDSITVELNNSCEEVNKSLTKGCGHKKMPSV